MVVVNVVVVVAVADEDHFAYRGIADKGRQLHFSNFCGIQGKREGI